MALEEQLKALGFTDIEFAAVPGYATVKAERDGQIYRCAVAPGISLDCAIDAFTSSTS